MTAAVEELMRALAQPPATIVGHSLGCRVAVETALQAPEHTKAVILVDGSQFAAAMGPALRATFARADGLSPTESQKSHPFKDSPCLDARAVW